LSLQKIQHHHAHVASCLVDNEWPLQPAGSSEKVLGVALDGLGYGADDTLWGAEFLLADYRSSQRVASFDAIAMPGGAMAIREPWRNTFASIAEYLGWEDFSYRYSHLELCRYLRTKPVELLQKMLNSGLGAPRASSCGRLFDAVAAALGLAREHAYYEGEGAIALEMLVDRQLFAQRLRQQCPDGPSAYVFALRQEGTLWRISAGPMWMALLEDLHKQIPLPEIALRFHLGLARAIADMVEQLSLNYSFGQVVLCGGCAQNRLLAEALQHLLPSAGFPLLLQARVPANDGGLSLGQAAIAAARQIDAKQSAATG
jgi:hydrogenase maturation protein HypF